MVAPESSLSVAGSIVYVPKRKVLDGAALSVLLLLTGKVGGPSVAARPLPRLDRPEEALLDRVGCV